MAQRKSSRKTNSKRRTSRPSPAKSAGSRKAKAGSTKHKGAATVGVGDQEVTIDRRRPVNVGGQAAASNDKSEYPQKLERRQKVNRRRQIDPTTCERDYTVDEIEFMNALDDYKRKSGRMFPTCSEVLEVVRSLGYVRLSASELADGKFDGAAATAGSAPENWFSDKSDVASQLEDDLILEAALAD